MCSERRCEQKAHFTQILIVCWLRLLIYYWHLIPVSLMISKIKALEEWDN